MNITKCENGHFYDSERYAECPHCNNEIQKITNDIIKDFTDDKTYNIYYLNISIERYKNHPDILDIIPIFAELVYNNLDETITSKINLVEYKNVYSMYYDCLSMFDIIPISSSRLDEAIYKYKIYVTTCEDLINKINADSILSAQNYIEYILNNENNRAYECGLNLSKAYFQLGYLCNEDKDYDAAHQYLEKALEYNKYCASIKFEIAEIYKIKGDYEQFYNATLEAFEKIYFTEDLARYYRNLGFYYIEKKNYELAKALFNYSQDIYATDIAKNELKYIGQLTNDQYPFNFGKFYSENILRKNNISPTFCDETIKKIESIKESWLDSSYLSIIEESVSQHKRLSFNHKENKYCTQCGIIIPSVAIFCPKCGANLELDPNATACLCECGGSFADRDKFCSGCGKEIVRRNVKKTTENNLEEKDESYYKKYLEQYIDMKVESQNDITNNQVAEEKQSSNAQIIENKKYPFLDNVLFGRYRMQQGLAITPFNTVYIAKDISTNSTCVVKISDRNSNEFNELKFNSFSLQAKFLSKFNHSSIPRLYDFFEDDVYSYIVMEYVESVSLDKLLLDRGRQPEDLVVNWAMQVCDIITYLSSFNPPIVNRNINPKNLKLLPDGSIKMFDFSIAREYVPGLLADENALGTVGFASPEQYGTAQTDVRSDIYGLGATIFNLVTGKFPKDNKISEIRELNPSISKGLEYVVLKCTNNDQNERYQTAEELKEDLLDIKNLPPKKSGLFNIFK